MKRIKITRHKGSTERQILIGMITNSEFLRDIQQIYKRQYFSGSYSVLIAKWCIGYYKKYAQAPGIHIRDIFKNAVRDKTLKDESRIQTIEKFLSHLSKEFERSDKFNAKFMLEQARQYFNSQLINALTQQAEQLRKEGKDSEASDLLESYKRIEITENNIVSLKTSKKLINAFHDDGSKPLFLLPGDIGKMMNDEFLRESFIGIMGPEKIGKTWLLLWIAKQAAKQRCNVLFVQAGDMSEMQQLRRLAISITNQTNSPKYAGKKIIPVLDCEHNQLDKCKVPNICKNDDPEPLFEEREEYYARFLNVYSKRDDFEEFWQMNKEHIACTECRRQDAYKHFFKGSIWFKEEEVQTITRKSIHNAHKKFKRRMRGHRLRIITYPNSTLTCDMLANRIDYLREKEDFVVDVVLVDYPDIMAGGKEMDFRHSENQKWKDLRAMSQQYKACFIAPTQADGASYGQKVLKRANYSEDKRKYSHVTAFFTLNQLEVEKAVGILRVGCLMSRDNEQETEHCTVLQHLSTGRAHIASYF